jgi:16S rRNA (cytosine1402-N4)-methyltransferase
LNTLSDNEKPKLELVQNNFSNIDDVLSSIPVDGVDGVLMDLGVSSYQIDNTDRGFSFKQNCILDMRMNPQSEISALDVVNTYSEYELSNLIYKYSDEIYAKKIANNIVKSRKTQAIKTSDQLVEIIKNSIPARARRHGGHPAKRTFQALRIEVNDEIKKLNDALDQIIKWLNTGGVIAIISYHSLEDRIVKSKFKSCVNRCTCPKTLPKCICGRKPIFNIITNKPIMAKDSEVKENRRSRSAKLRVAKRI